MLLLYYLPATRLGVEALCRSEYRRPGALSRRRTVVLRQRRYRLRMRDRRYAGQQADAQYR